MGIIKKDKYMKNKNFLSIIAGVLFLSTISAQSVQARVINGEEAMNLYQKLSVLQETTEDGATVRSASFLFTSQFMEKWIPESETHTLFVTAILDQGVCTQENLSYVRSQDPATQALLRYLTLSIAGTEHFPSFSGDNISGGAGAVRCEKRGENPTDYSCDTKPSLASSVYKCISGNDDTGYDVYHAARGIYRGVNYPAQPLNVPSDN